LSFLKKIEKYGKKWEIGSLFFEIGTKNAYLFMQKGIPYLERRSL